MSIISLVLLLVLIAAPVIAGDTLALRQLEARLLLAGAAGRFPAEFGSFLASLEAAEAPAARAGEPLARQLLELAALKGKVLEGKLSNPLARESSAVQIANGDTVRETKATSPANLLTVPERDADSTHLQQLRLSVPVPPTVATVSLPELLPESQPDNVVPDEVLGGKKEYTVKKGDSLRGIAARLGVNWRQFARENGIDIKKPFLIAGMKLKYNDRKIVPKNIGSGLLVNIPEKTLFLFDKGEVRLVVPVTVGRPMLASSGGAEDAPTEELTKWQTPTGIFTITGKLRNPTWNVPRSIQEEMRQQGREVRTLVPPGKNNPLGRYALKTSMRGIMLHSTNMPASIFTFNSHGCIRVAPEAMEALYRDVGVNSRGEIIYMPVKTAVTADGRVFVEVHRDVYGRKKDLFAEVQDLVRQYNIDDKVDWQKIRRVVRQKSGIAEDVTRRL